MSGSTVCTALSQGAELLYYPYQSLALDWRGVMTFLFPGTLIGSGQLPKERSSCEPLLAVNTRSECGGLAGTGSPSLEKDSVGGTVIALPQKANGRGDSNPDLHPGADSARSAGFLQPCHLDHCWQFLNVQWYISQG